MRICKQNFSKFVFNISIIYNYKFVLNEITSTIQNN